MVNIKRTLTTTFASSGLPQDLVVVDPDVRVPATTGISTNSTDVANPTILVGITNLATTIGQVDTTNPIGLNDQPLPLREDPPLALNPTNVANPTILTGTTNLTTTTSQVDTINSVDLNDQPLQPREDPPLAPRTEGMTNVEQPPSTMTGSSPRYYASETERGIGKPAIGEPHVDLGEDLELARLKEAVCQVGQTEEPHAVGCDVFAQQRRKFLRWMMTKSTSSYLTRQSWTAVIKKLATL
uniref:Uncharacterized protein n=1 Tax=Cannabis sativa TaxID=3483 RepID=A0A803PTM4_CANSA